jgi:hypothetical protein
MATITHDTLDWYGWDEDGAGVHDIIGTRCDPYTNLLLKGMEYHRCCHSNLTRALAAERNLPLDEAEVHVHDVMNVFMCTGYTRDTHQYFMKASPVRPGDFIEFFAQIDLLVALSACPGGDCGTSHSDDTANAIRSRSRSIGRPSARWPAGSHHCRTNILARMEPGEGSIRLIRGSLAQVMVRFGRRRSGTCPKVSAAPQQADHPMRYINRLFSARS